MRRLKLKQHNPYHIILSGGGTGGHIFPAIAIANELRASDPTVEILFVGAIGKMEMEKVPKAGYKITGLPVSAFHRRLTLKNLMFPFRLLASMIKAARVISDFKPDLVIGTGGFASGPVLRVATRRSIPTLIQEQNSFPGVTNRLLAQKVARICVAFPGMERYFPAGKIVFTGNPVRSGLKLPASRIGEARERFNITSGRPVILVFGGSQGARTLNLSLFSHLEKLAHAPVEILWQTGTSFYNQAKSAVEALDANNIRVMEFIYEMDFAYTLSNLVVCRSGAITLSELAITGKPAILVPLPSAAENHQAKNALAFVESGAALMVTDSEAPEKLVNTMLALAHEPAKLASMSEQMLKFAKPNAAAEIAAIALKLLPETRNPIPDTLNQ
ncbi:MAG: undecaprenyldiphospho-muramoylpentapeptide beta-N-acetylglucosaminyltransferase [Bacteroidales bacterium]|jgi:UDP-N-acetylglucosamine--N-acetylmuramyl-(pentapeptide) pyrophosphoryl-undecaprenol N-acetylglucosamine transferase